MMCKRTDHCRSSPAFTSAVQAERRSAPSLLGTSVIKDDPPATCFPRFLEPSAKLNFKVRSRSSKITRQKLFRLLMFQQGSFRRPTKALLAFFAVSFWGFGNASVEFLLQKKHSKETSILPYIQSRICHDLYHPRQAQSGSRGIQKGQACSSCQDIRGSDRIFVVHLSTSTEAS